MNRIGFFTTVLFGAILLTGCMSARDRVAVRLGMDTSEEKAQAYHERYVAAQKWERSQQPKVVAKPTPVRYEEPKVVKAAPVYPELQWKPQAVDKKQSAQAQARYYELEKQSAKLRFEASLMRNEAGELRAELQSLDGKWSTLTVALEDLRAERMHLNETMKQLDARLADAQKRIEKVEAERSRMAFDIPKGKEDHHLFE